MGKTFVHIRNPHTLPARQRRAGAHEDETDNVDTTSRPAYVQVLCQSCKQKTSVPDWKIDYAEEIHCSACKEPIVL